MRTSSRLNRRTFFQYVATAACVAPLASSAIARADDAGLSLLAVLEHDSLAGAHDIEVRENLAFVAGKTGRFAIVDVADTKAPSVLSMMNVEDEPALGNAQTVLLTGDTCLLGADALLAIDISDPASPSITHIVEDERIARINGMVQWGDHAIAVNKTGYLDVFDITDPRKPEFLGAADTRKEGNLKSPHDVATFGDRYLVVPSAGKDMPTYFGIYQISEDGEELSTAEEWKCLGTVSDPKLAGANRIVADSRYAYVVCHYSHRLGVIDLAEPGAPQLITTIRTAGYEPDGLALHGDKLFVGAGRTVEVFHVANPAEPQRVALYKGDPLFAESKGPGLGNAHDLVVKDGIVYVTAQRDNRIGILKFES